MTDTSKEEAKPPTGRDDVGTDDETGVASALEEPLVGNADGGDTELPLETVFDILRNERRQRVLGYLALSDDDVVRIGDLAEHIAAVENDAPVGGISSQQRKRVYVALYQCHLPKMADANVVDFDKDRGTVAEGPNAAQLRPYLDVGSRTEDAPEPADRTPLMLFSAAAVLAYVLAALADGTGGVLGGGAVIAAGGLAAILLAYRDQAT